MRRRRKRRRCARRERRGGDGARADVDTTPLDASSSTGDAGGAVADAGPTPAPTFVPPPPYDSTGAFCVSLRAPLAGTVVHYTMDGSLPTAASPIYSTPIAITGGTIFDLAARRGAIAPDRFRPCRRSPAPPTPRRRPTLTRR
ncbi:MAG: chitobiase/beta-hexosaminidase C-terminal domain-containing protein [Labilithrix sp.]